MRKNRIQDGGRHHVEFYQKWDIWLQMTLGLPVSICTQNLMQISLLVTKTGPKIQIPGGSGSSHCILEF